MTARRLSMPVMLAAGLLALAVSLAGAPARIGGVAPFLAELLLIGLGAALALRATRARLGTDRSSRAPLRVAAVLLALIALGQIGRSKHTFPLIPYRMYGRAQEGAAVLYQYEAHHRSGRQTRFAPGAVIRTLGRARIAKGLARELDAIAALEQAGRPTDARRQLLRETMAALAAHHNREHSADPVVQVEVLRVVVEPPFRPSTAQRTSVMTLDVSAEP